MSTRLSHPPRQRIVPPLNFCPVENQLYRSGQPTTINQAFLSGLHLKTIIWLATEEPSEDFLDYCSHRNIDLEFVGMLGDYDYDATVNPWDALSEATIRRSLQLIGDRANYPILVCCGMGRHRTGTVIGCLRRLQNWNLASVSEEYRRFTGARGGRIQVELLIESFDIDTVAVDVAAAPAWLVRDRL